jgi:outer membrane lipoprotein-sorting protein
VAALIGAGAWIPRMDAAAAPHLPKISSAQVIAKVLSEHVSHFSGTVRWSADLGLPSLSNLTGAGGQAVSASSAFDPTSLLSGSQDFDVWIAGANRERIELPGTLEESDVVRDGNQAWVWDSSTAHVTHYVLAGTKTSRGAEPDAVSDGEQVTPQALAARILAGLRQSTTSVSVANSVSIDGHSAYVLRLAPDRTVAANRASTISSIDIAVDASTGLPLRISIYAVGQAAPALQVGYTSISYSAPSSADLAAPHGETTSTKVIHPHKGQRASSLRPRASSKPGHVIGADWGSIFAVSGADLYEGSSGMAFLELESVTTAVSGPWGSGRLLTSSLINALFLPNGRVLVGLTSPAALEQAVAGTAS